MKKIEYEVAIKSTFVKGTIEVEEDIPDYQVDRTIIEDVLDSGELNLSWNEVKK